MAFIDALEKEIGMKAVKSLNHFNQGMSKNTSADTQKNFNWIKYKPYTRKGYVHY